MVSGEIYVFYSGAMRAEMATKTPSGTENGSADSVVELQRVPAAVVRDTVAKQATLKSEIEDRATSGDINGQIPPPATAVDALERWDSPKMNRWRVLATFSSVLPILPPYPKYHF